MLLPIPSSRSFLCLWVLERTRKISCLAASAAEPKGTGCWQRSEDPWIHIQLPQILLGAPAEGAAHPRTAEFTFNGSALAQGGSWAGRAPPPAGDETITSPEAKEPDLCPFSSQLTAKWREKKKGQYDGAAGKHPLRMNPSKLAALGAGNSSWGPTLPLPKLKSPKRLRINPRPRKGSFPRAAPLLHPWLAAQREEQLQARRLPGKQHQTLGEGAAAQGKKEEWRL